MSHFMPLTHADKASVWTAYIPLCFKVHGSILVWRMLISLCAHAYEDWCWMLSRLAGLADRQVLGIPLVLPPQHRDHRQHMLLALAFYMAVGDSESRSSCMHGQHLTGQIISLAHNLCMLHTHDICLSARVTFCIDSINYKWILKCVKFLCDYFIYCYWFARVQDPQATACT